MLVGWDIYTDENFFVILRIWIKSEDFGWGLKYNLDFGWGLKLNLDFGCVLVVLIRTFEISDWFWWKRNFEESLLVVGRIAPN